MRIFVLALMLAATSVTVATPAASACPYLVQVGGSALVSACVQVAPPQDCTGGIPLDLEVNGFYITQGATDICVTYVNVLP